MINYFLSFFLLNHAEAALHPCPGAGLQNPLWGCPAPTICDLLGRIATGLIEIGGAISAVMLLIGAFQILFAAGDPKRVQSGKNTILYTVIGYVILVSSSAIAYIVADLLGGGGPSAC